MASAHSHLKHCYAIRDGKIDPWGTIRILANGVVADGVFSNAPLPIQTGLGIYSEKLVQYGNDQFRVRISTDSSTVRVFDKDDVLVKEISFDDFMVVIIHEALVHDDGHLKTLLSNLDKHDWQPWKNALRQAAAGKKPSFCDNSPFTQIDEKFAGETVIVLSWGISPGKQAVVYTKSGERIPSKVHYPLSYAKWEPRSEYAAFSEQKSSTN